MIHTIHKHRKFKQYRCFSFRSVSFAVFFLFLFFSTKPCAAGTEEFPVRTVQAPVGNIYIRPAESASLVDTLKQGDRLTLIGKEGEWYMARLPDQRLGWVHESLFGEIPAADELSEKEIPAADTLSDTPAEKQQEIMTGSEEIREKDFLFQALVTVPSARVREKPSRNAAVVFGLEKGDRVIVSEVSDNWYHIHSEEGQSGWAFHTLFRQAEETEIVSFPPKSAADSVFERKPPFRASSRIDNVRVRENPSYQATVRFQLGKGDVVSVTEIRDDWLRIEQSEGKSGWAHRLLFTNLPEDTGSAAIQSVRFETDSDESEKVIVTLNGFYPPDETFPLDEDIPKVVCDFYNVSIADSIDSIIPVNGKLIRKIRIGIHKGPRPKVRVVVDLDPDKKYSVEQVFFKQSNRYSLTFRPLGK